MIENLNHDPVRIFEVKGTGTISMSLQFLHDFGALFFDMGIPFIHLIGRWNKETNVIEIARAMERGICLMERKVIKARAFRIRAGDIYGLGIRLPFDLHLHDTTIEVL